MGCGASRSQTSRKSDEVLSSSLRCIERTPEPEAETEISFDLEINVAHTWTDRQGRKVVNQFVELSTIGEGTWGTVSLVQSLKSEKRYAMKVIGRGTTRTPAPRDLSDPSRCSADQNACSRQSSTSTMAPWRQGGSLLTELEVLKKLTHPNIVKLMQIIDDPDHRVVYIILEYVKGGPVLHLNGEGVAVEGPLEEEVSKGYFKQVVEGLSYLHNNNITHSDLKPENILLERHTGTIKLSDFGVSVVFSSSDDTTRKGQGTPLFMPPECCGNAKYVSGKASDVWALGITLYIFTYGRVPWTAKLQLLLYQEILHETISFPTHAIAPLNAAPSEELLSILKRMLNKSVLQRITLPEIQSHPWLGKGTAELLKALGKTASLEEIGDEVIEPVDTSSFGPLSPNQLRCLSVLVVEDVFAVRSIVERMFEEVLYDSSQLTVVGVSDGQAAIDASASQSFNLILMDIHMSPVNGFEATTRIREIEKYTTVSSSIIAMTADTTPKLELLCKEAGMDGLVMKPLTPLKLKAICQGLGYRVKLGKSGTGFVKTPFKKTHAHWEAYIQYLKQHEGEKDSPEAPKESPDGDPQAMSLQCRSRSFETVSSTPSRGRSFNLSPSSPTTKVTSPAKMLLLYSFNSAENLKDNETKGARSFKEAEQIIRSNDGVFLFNIERSRTPVGSSQALKFMSQRRETPPVTPARDQRGEPSFRAAMLYDLSRKRSELQFAMSASDEDLRDKVITASLLLLQGSLRMAEMPIQLYCSFREVVEDALRWIQEHHSNFCNEAKSKSRRTRMWCMAKVKDFLTAKFDDWIDATRAQLIAEAKVQHLYPVPCLDKGPNIIRRHVEVSECKDRGQRSVMEDLTCVIPHITNCLLDGSKGTPEERHLHSKSHKAWVDVTELYAAVFDGHQGLEAASYAQDHLHHHLVRSPHYATNVEEALRDAFCKTHDAFLTIAEETFCDAGTTASVSLVLGSKLHVANVGDSGAVLCRAGQALVLSERHHVTNVKEVSAVKGRGGTILNVSGQDRVDGCVTVTRAIGDRKIQKHLSHLPHVVTTEVTEEDSFLILATDGLWDVIPPTEAVAFVQQARREVDLSIRAMEWRHIRELQRSREGGSSCASREEYSSGPRSTRTGTISSPSGCIFRSNVSPMRYASYPNHGVDRLSLGVLRRSSNFSDLASPSLNVPHATAIAALALVVSLTPLEAIATFPQDPRASLPSQDDDEATRVSCASGAW
eukprot:Sspe_Gene.22493::Locus_8573_Transcript_1_1_Confidence_1.000_Length_3755::g.22493::m.22493